MHIVIDARIISSSTGRYIERILHYLQDLDRENHYTVLVLEKDKEYWQPKHSNFTVEVANFKPYSFSEQFGFLRQLNRYKADLVHFSQVHQPVFYRGPKVTTIHDLTLLKTYNPDKNWFVYHAKQLVGRVVFSRVARTSRFILTPSNFTRQEILDRYKTDPSKIITTHLAGEMRTKKIAPYSSLVDTPFIMYVGQQSAYKNIARLGDAHQALLTTHPELRLVLVGKIDRSAEQNKAYFEAKGYKNIIFTGFTDDDQLNWLYANTRAYIFPSFMEGFGLPGLEAMLMGAPVVSSNATCLPEVYGNAALYFSPDDTKEMVTTIDSVLGDSALRDNLIKKGSLQVGKYHWRRTAQETWETYLRALRG